MKNIQFKCTLLSDVIINQKAATEGNQHTLDFIPGSAFLGIAAGLLYEDKSAESMLLFHSGKVRFGDAHPLSEGKRAVRIPASWYYRKGDSNKSILFVHHGMPEEGLKENGNPVQIKQCRDGFMVNNGNGSVSEVEINKHFAIKSAYDSANRRSEDQKMYGYESLEAGSEWCFELTIDSDFQQLETKVVKALTGKKRVGRSSTAQYGLVEIEVRSFKSSFETENPIQVKIKGKEVPAILIYAESRLVFIDQYGQSTFTPTKEQLGVKTGTIDWSKSQIRTFQYASYNNCRKTRDADHCGIEKGSVFCITGATTDDIDQLILETGVGAYLNEGFGKVLVNPEFLAFKNEDNLKGKSIYKFTNEKVKAESFNVVNKVSHLLANSHDSLVFKYLEMRQAQQHKQEIIYESVNNFVENSHNKFRSDTFASQWGTIRSIAMKAKTLDELKDKLYNKPNGYLVHGVAMDKWNEQGRLKLLKDFISVIENENFTGIAIAATINLSAEMAKKCKKEDKR